MSQPDLDLPVWRALLPSQDSEACHVLHLDGSEVEWRAELRKAVDSRAEWFLIAGDRAAALALLKLLPWRKHSGGVGASRATILEAVSSVGLEPISLYSVWPTAGSPRVAYPLGAKRSFRWLQRSGVIGGGGSRVWARMLAQSRFATPILSLLAPGIILVSRRGSVGRTP